MWYSIFNDFQGAPLTLEVIVCIVGCAARAATEFGIAKLTTRRKPGFYLKECRVMKKLTREQIAAWLAARGVGRNRLLWQLVYALSPVVAGMVSTFSEAMQPENQLVWWHDPESDTHVIQGILDEVGELITRAPTPLGLDTYCVFVTSLGGIPGDPAQMTGDQADETLHARPAVAVQLVEGDRWRDWKRGSGRDSMGEVLERLHPRPDRPVTLIQVAVVGSGVARSLRAFGAW
jgi:hypothetical protein